MVEQLAAQLAVELELERLEQSKSCELQPAARLELEPGQQLALEQSRSCAIELVAELETGQLAVEQHAEPRQRRKSLHHTS